MTMPYPRHLLLELLGHPDTPPRWRPVLESIRDLDRHAVPGGWSCEEVAVAWREVEGSVEP